MFAELRTITSDLSRLNTIEYIMQLRRVLYQIKAILLTCHDEALEKQYEQVEQELQKQIEKTNK